MENLTKEECKINKFMSFVEEEKQEADELEQSLYILKQLLYEKNLEDINLNYEKIFSFKSSSKSNQMSKSYSISPDRKIKLSELTKLDSFTSSFSQFKHQKLLKTFKFTIEDDQKLEFVPFEVLQLDKFQEHPLTIIDAQKAKILVIVFWDSEESLSLELLDYLDMLFSQGDTQFEAKARLIGINLEENDILASQIIKKKKWKIVENYQLLKDSDVCDDYQVDEIPHVLLVDPDNKIVFDNPTTVDESEELLEKINELLQSIEKRKSELSKDQFSQLEIICQEKLPVEQLQQIVSLIEFKIEFIERQVFTSAGKLLKIQYFAKSF